MTVLLRAQGVLLPLAAWTCWAPLGAKYAVAMASVLVAAALLATRRARVAEWLQTPGMAAAVGLWLLLAVSVAWTPARWTVALGQLGQYALALLLAAVATTCPAGIARRALDHFIAASGVAALVFVLAAAGALPEAQGLWHTTTQAEGNQRIAASILLALAVALATWRAAGARARLRLAWAAVALLCLTALALQDRRSGMLLLPMLLLALAWSTERRWSRRLPALLTVGLVLLATWQLSGTVRQRFDEGRRELQAYRADDQVSTSWGQRLRLWQTTAAMVAERPLLGHGVGSWTLRWSERVTPGTPLAANTTPHSEYLLLAHQAGLAAPLLWLGWLLVVGRAGWKAGWSGVPALLAATALGWSGLFNAVLRDAKFALPLLLLAALGLAAARDPAGRGN